MMKTQDSRKIFVILSLVLLLFGGCSALQPVLAQALPGGGLSLNGNGRGIQAGGSGVVSQVAVQPATATVTTAEAAGLTYMREEEKLAHDVYVTLFTQWQLPIFQTIAKSEQTHTDAILTLLQRYGLPDPAMGNGVGVFTDATLQTLYDQLVAQGSQSLTAALTVGATIEDLDIVDLQTRVAQTNQRDIRQVYTNLLRGSGNHLRAFTKLLAQQRDVIYQPQYLDQASYAAIIAASNGRGHGPNR